MLPSAAKSLSKSKDGGKFIPKVLVTSADGSEGLKAVAYEVLKGDARKAARELRRTLASRVEEAAEEPIAVESSLLAEEQEWTNAQGKAIRAAVVSVSADNVEFLMKKKKVSYPLSKLSTVSAAKLRELVE